MAELLSATEVRYLLAIRSLGEDKPVRSIDIASRLGVRKSSVSAKLKELVFLDLVSKAPYGRVVLTEKGRSVAWNLEGRIQAIDTFLMRNLGIGKESAEPLALAMLARMDDRTMEAIERSNGDSDQRKRGAC